MKRGARGKAPETQKTERGLEILKKDLPRTPQQATSPYVIL